MLLIVIDEPAANEDSLTEPSNVSAVVIVLSFNWKLTLVPEPSTVKLLTVRSGATGGGGGGGAVDAMFQPIASNAVRSEDEIGSITPGVPYASNASCVALDAQSPRSPPG